MREESYSHLPGVNSGALTLSASEDADEASSELLDGLVVVVAPPNDSPNTGAGATDEVLVVGAADVEEVEEVEASPKLGADTAKETGVSGTGSVRLAPCPKIGFGPPDPGGWRLVMNGLLDNVVVVEEEEEEEEEEETGVSFSPSSADFLV